MNERLEKLNEAVNTLRKLIEEEIGCVAIVVVGGVTDQKELITTISYGDMDFSDMNKIYYDINSRIIAEFEDSLESTDDETSPY